MEALFTVIGADADNGLVPLCGMIAGNESLETWMDMIQYLVTHFPGTGGKTWIWMSDREKGLEAAEQLCGEAQIQHCILHFEKNMESWKDLTREDKRRLNTFMKIAGYSTSADMVVEAKENLGLFLFREIQKRHPMKFWAPILSKNFTYNTYVNNGVEAFFGIAKRFGWKPLAYVQLLCSLFNYYKETMEKKREEFTKIHSGGIGATTKGCGNSGKSTGRGSSATFC